MMSTQEKTVERVLDENTQLQRRLDELEAQLRMLKSGIVSEAAPSQAQQTGFQRLRFLEEVSRRLSISLDPQKTLIELARLAVPALGDWCAVYQPKDDATLEPLVVHHSDPAKVAQVQRMLERDPIRQDADGGAGAAFRTGKPQLIPKVTDAMIESLVSDPDQLALIKGLEIRSGMNLPMMARGKVLGVIDVVSSDPQRPYGEADLALGMEFAHRVAAALDNARLYAELRKANERFELAEHASGGYVYEWDTATNQMTRSANFTNVLGHAEVTSQRDEWFDLIHPDDRQRVQDETNQAMRDGGAFSIEYRVRHRDGHYLHVWNQGTVVLKEGRPVRTVGIVVDISKRKSIEEELSEREAQMRQMADAMPQLVWVADHAGVVSYYNQRAKEYIGLNPNRDGNWRWQPVLHPDDLVATERAWREATAAGTPYVKEHRLQMANGAYRWHLSRAYPYRDESGHIATWYGTATDIHDLKLAKEASEIANYRYRVAEEAAQSFSFDWDVNAGVVVRSNGLKRVLGYEPDELPANWQGWLAVLHPNDPHPDLNALIAQLQRHPSDIVETEYRARHKQGPYRWLYERAILLRDDAGKLHRVIGQTVDITERRQAEHDARFFAGIGEIINRAGNPQDLMWQVVNATATYLETGRAGFNEIDAAKQVITFHRDYSLNSPSIAGEYALTSFGHALAQEMRAGRAMAIGDTQTDSRTADEYVFIYAPVGLRAILSVPMMRNGEWMASLWVASAQPRDWTERETDVLRTVAERAWVAVESARVQAETQALNATLEARVSERTRALRESQAQLRQLTAHVARAREDERSRIAREVHDELGGALTVMKMSLAQIAKRIEPEAGVNARLDDLRRQIDVLVQSVRRISYDLRPSMLDDFGLLATMEWQAMEWRQRTGIPCTLDLPRDADTRLNDKVRTAVFRVFQESLTNIARHANATQVNVSAMLNGDQLIVTVQDNGRGIRPDALQDSASLGLMSMRERMREVGGDVTFNSEAGKGTTVILRVPAG